MNKDLTVLEVGKPFTLFESSHLKNKDASILEMFPNGEMVLSLHMYNMNKSEILLFRKAKISVKIIHELDYLLTLIKFADSQLIFELSFDPTKYSDNRVDKLMNSNMLQIIGIESSSNIIKSLRIVSVPFKLFNLWITVWGNARNIPGYVTKYDRWVNDLDKRYSLLDLWDRGTYIGKMGEKE